MKLNILIDGYFFMYKNLYYLTSRGANIDNLLIYMMTEFDKLYNKFTDANFIIAYDDKNNNFRYNIYSKYKDNRLKDKSIDWKLVYKQFDEFIIKIQEKYKSVKVITVPFLEADDMIYYICKESNKIGYSNIIITSDQDYRQFLLSRLNYINIKYDYLDPSSVDIAGKSKGNGNIYAALLLNELIKRKKITNKISISLQNIFNNSKINIVNPEFNLFKQIVIGKPVYNINGIIKTKAGKIDKTGQYIGLTGVQGLYRLYKQTYTKQIDFGSKQFIRRLLIATLLYKNITSITDEQKQQLYNDIKQNINLCYINEETIPAEYLNNLKEVYENTIKEISK